MKNNLFFNRFPFLLAIASILCFTSCFPKTEQQIRTEVEKEMMQKVNAMLQTPKHILSESDTRFVAEQFQKTKIQVDIKTTVCTLKNGTVISFQLDKNLNHTFWAKYGDIEVEALRQTTLPLGLDGSIIKQLGNCYTAVPSCLGDIKIRPFEVLYFPEFKPDPLCETYSQCLARCVANSSTIHPNTCHTTCFGVLPCKIERTVGGTIVWKK